MQHSYREQVDKLHHQLTAGLNTAIRDLSSLQNVNKQLDDVVSKFTETLQNDIIEVENAMEKLHRNAVWDNLVIALFGVTNAGKSTIIETLRARFDHSRMENSDGLIVGTGESDFTKACQEYKLSIGDRVFTLIDVPGIEGNEADFREEIIKALNKAHCVFFVNGENKKPDAAMAEKIGKYLADWVNVYSIYNIRGGVSNYDEECERVSLLTANFVKIGREIEVALGDALGDVYKGNISIQGLIALASVASFHPSLQNSLGKSQSKLIKYFGSREGMFDFSRFFDVESLIEEKSQNFAVEIAQANKRKLIGLTKKAFYDIQRVVDDEKYNIERYQSLVDRFEKEVLLVFSSTKNQIKQNMKSAYDDMYDNMRDGLYDLIERDCLTRDAATSVVEDAYSDYLRESQDIINKILRNMNARLKKAKNEMHGWRAMIRSVSMSDTMTFNIEIDSAIKKMEISFEDFGSAALDVGGAALTGMFFGPIGAGVGAILGLLSHVGRRKIFGDGGRGEARQSISNTLQRSYDANICSLDRITYRIISDLNRSKGSVVSQIRLEKKNLQDMSEIISKTQLNLRMFVTELKY